MQSDLLTPRQVEIASLIYKGCCNRVIGESLGISEETVKRHLSAILEKANCRSRSEFCSKRIDTLEQENAQLRSWLRR